jgi:hypothetical protein
MKSCNSRPGVSNAVVHFCGEIVGRLIIGNGQDQSVDGEIGQVVGAVAVQRAAMRTAVAQRAVKAATAQRAAQARQLREKGVQPEMSNTSKLDSQYRNGHRSGYARLYKRPVSD